MRQSQLVPILMYHALEDEPSPISLSPARFAEQMGWLEADGIRVWTFGDLLGWLRAGGPATERTVVLTFDDGFRSLLTRGLPVLARHGFRATVFLTTGHLGGRNDWPTQPASVPRWDLVSWAEARELASAGIEIGAHSVTHPWLPLLSSTAARDEILGSKRAIEDALGQPVETFAYPYGAYTDAVRAMVLESFRGACTASLRRVDPRSDPWALPRLDACYVVSLPFVRRLWSPGLAPWLSARRALRRVRRLTRPGQGRGTI